MLWSKTGVTDKETRMIQGTGGDNRGVVWKDGDGQPQSQELEACLAWTL